MRRIFLAVGLVLILSLAVISFFIPTDKTVAVHTFLIDNIGTMVTNQGTTSNPTSAAPNRVFVANADDRFFVGRILFTVTDSVDGDALVPRVTVEVYNGASYVSSIAIDGTDDSSKTSDLPLTGFDPVGGSSGQETFRMYLAATDEIGNARDTTATIAYVFVAHTQE